jgi:hypothetical protein
MTDPVILGLAAFGTFNLGWWTAVLAKRMFRHNRKRAVRMVAERKPLPAPLNWAWSERELWEGLLRDRDAFERTVLDAAGGHPLEPFQLAALCRIVWREPAVTGLQCLTHVAALANAPALDKEGAKP